MSKRACFCEKPFTGSYADGCPVHDPGAEFQKQAPAEGALFDAVVANYDHPSGVWCQGCQVNFDVKAMVDDLREAGFEILPVPPVGPRRGALNE